MIYKGRNKQALLHALVIGLGTLVLTSVWWIPMLLRFGLAPFLSAAQTGLHDASTIVYFFFIPFTEEPYVTFVAVLAIVGIAVKIAESEYLWPMLYALPFLIEPRNAPNVVAIHMALLSGFALCELILPRLSQLEGRSRKIEFQKLLESRAEKFLTLYIGVNLLIGMLYFDTQLAEKRISAETQEAFTWIMSNTPEDSRFLILTGVGDPLLDWTQEWFPVLTERRSLTTLQGYEWLEGDRFKARYAAAEDLQGCLAEADPLECVNAYVAQLGSDYEFIYSTRTGAHALTTQLLQDSGHIAVYQSEDILIFRKGTSQE